MVDVVMREIKTSDQPAVAQLIETAFGEAEGPLIAQLVHALLDDPTAHPLLSLVATSGDRVVGHVLFTHARIEGGAAEAPSAILAPLAVHPDLQRRGIGGRLIAEGVRRLTQSGVELVFVLGDPNYYGRHGFSPAGVKRFPTPQPIPEKYHDAWMLRTLGDGVMDAVSGQVACAEALDKARYWGE